MSENLHHIKKVTTFALEFDQLRIINIGKVVEWSITAVLKTAVPRGTGGSNPSLSAENEIMSKY